MEMDYNLKKLANFFKFSLQTDQIVGQQSTLEGSFCKNLLQIFFSCSKKFIPTRKGDRELYLWSFDEKTAKLQWHSPFKVRQWQESYVKIEWQSLC